MKSLKPQYDALAIQAPYALNIGSTLVCAVALDLRYCEKAYLHAGVALSGSTDWTNSVALRIKPQIYDGTAYSNFGDYNSSTVSGKAACARAINLEAGYAAGVSSLAYDGSGGTLWAVGDTLALWGATAVPSADGLLTTTGFEFVQAAKAGSEATPVTLVTPTKFAHADNELITPGTAWNIEIPGGRLYRIVFDASNNSAGGRAICVAYATRVPAKAQSII